MKSLNAGGRVPLCLSFLISVEGTQQGSPNSHGFGAGLLGRKSPWGASAMLRGRGTQGNRVQQLGVQNPLGTP